MITNKSTYPDTHILVLSMHNETQVVSRAMKAGASGYIGKDCSPQTLFEAIRKVITTGKYLSPELAEQLAYASTSPDPGSSAGNQLLRLQTQLHGVGVTDGGDRVCSSTVSHCRS